MMADSTGGLTLAKATAEVVTPGKMLEDMKFVWGLVQLVDHEIQVSGPYLV